MRTRESTIGVAEAYDALADTYDLLTAAYCHDVWLLEIERRAKRHGLTGKRLLDLGCGTGKSFLPLAARGYAVTACDISPRMVEIARAKCPAAAVAVEDIRALPRLGEFDLITCLDDAVNYLLEPGELQAFFDGVSRNLAPWGVAVFDANTLKVYREDFVRDWLIDDPRAFIAWTAAPLTRPPGDERFAATVHVFEPDGAGWTRTTSHHEQRHWPPSAFDRAAGAAGLRVASVYGQHRGARLDPELDERVHNKGLYVVTRDRKAVSEMSIIGP